MKKLLAPIIALSIITPGHAVSIVSLHGAPTPSVSIFSSTGGTAAVVSLLALCSVIAYRMYKRKGS